MADDTFTRSYHRFPDEFPAVYADDSAYALWCRLRDEADKTWPSSAPLPLGVKRRALKMLTDAELVFLQPGSRYRIRGLDKERERRAEPARRSARTRWDRVREQQALDALADEESMRSHHGADADAMRTHSERNATAMLPEPTRAEPTRADPSRPAPSARASFDNRREGLPSLTPEAEDAILGATGIMVASLSDSMLGHLDRLVGEHGLEATCAEMAAARERGARTPQQVVFRARDRLEPLREAVPSEDDEVARLAAETEREYAEHKARQAAVGG